MINMTNIIFLILLLHCTIATKLNQAKFAKDFLFGVATSSYQIEGAWNEDGKSENIWDRYTFQHPDRILEHANGNIACDSYHRTKEDVQLIKNLGVDYYRFSLSWSRIIPDPFSHTVNHKGIDYYNTLINELIAYNITPMVTLYHFDLPQKLQDFGGWTNPLLEGFFEDYARVAFKHFGDRVKFWITFNEPTMICGLGYGNGSIAPGVKLQEFGDIYCGHTLIKSHARVYHVYNNEFKPKYNGKVGFTQAAFWIEPETDSIEDAAAAEKLRQLYIGRYANPIFNNGDYPEVIKNIIYNINKKAEHDGFLGSRLPHFTEEEKKFIKGTYDYFAINSYSTRLVRSIPNKGKDESIWFDKLGTKLMTNKDWPESPLIWLKVVPWGFRKLLMWIKETYGDLEIHVTENGYADHRGQLDDVDRIIYLQLYLSALLDAIDSGVNVKSYAFWSLLDNFEWNYGYKYAFGLYSVDFEDPKLPRIPKKSVNAVKEIIKNRHLPKETNNKGTTFILKDEL